MKLVSGRTRLHSASFSVRGPLHLYSRLALPAPVMSSWPMSGNSDVQRPLATHPGSIL